MANWRLDEPRDDLHQARRSAWRGRGRAACWGLLWGLGLTSQARAQTLRVTSGSTLEARVVPALTGTEVRGRLLDDAGRGHAGAKVTAHLDPAAPGAPLVTACDASAPMPTRSGDAGGHVVSTDGAGEFCLRYLPAVRSEGRLRLTYAGDAHHAAAALNLPLEPSKSSVELSFSPDPGALALDHPQASVWLELGKSSSSFSAQPRLEVELELVEGSAPVRALGRVLASPGERFSLSFDSARLGSPGPARLSARVVGTPTTSSTEVSSVVQRTARVRLSVDTPPEPGNPSQGIPIRVKVDSVRGPLDMGSVEAMVHGTSAGTAEVRHGRALVTATFDASQPGQVPVTLIFHPSAAWWLAPPPLTLEIPIQGPSAWRRLPWLAVALLLAAYFAFAWRRPGPRRQLLSSPPGPLRPPARETVVIADVPRDAEGWYGVVRDAHDGQAVAAARVVILSVGFEAPSVIGSAESAADGSFIITGSSPGAAESLRLEVSAPEHSTLMHPVPRRGRLDVYVVQRRRAILTRLVEWAKARGRPWWPASGEPTPADLVALARRTGEPHVAQWAHEVQQASYGPTPPQDADERLLRAQEPGLRREP